MSVVFTGTNQGRFTSTGTAQIIKIRSDLDYMWVINETVAYAAGSDSGAQFYWQRGMANGRGVIYAKTTGTNALTIGQIAANSGFYLIDSSVNLPGPSLALTGITGANPPVVNTVNTASLNDFDVVRIFNTVGAQQLGGLDFTIDNINAGVSFELAYMAPIAAANPGAGTFRRIPFDPLYYPTRRYITKVIVATAGTAGAGNPAVQADQAIVTLSVTHGYTVGQVIRFIVPTVTATRYGMTELDGLTGTIIAIGDDDADGVTNTIRVDIDVSGFTAFAFPITTDPGFTPAQTIPVGDNTAYSLSVNANILSDSTTNTGYIGIQLQAGANSPAGVSSDVIYWVAGKSFSVDN